MRLFERIMFVAGLVVVGTTAVYRYVLTDEQRAALQEAGAAITNAVREVTDTVSPLVSDGPSRAEEEAMTEENRADTAAQWAALGY